MKATRRDIIKALKRHEMARLATEIEQLTKGLTKIPSFVEEITARALVEYKKRPGVKKLLKALTAAKIPHEVKTRFCGGNQGERDLARVHVEIEIPDAESWGIDVRMTDAEYKQVNDAVGINNTTNGQIAKLRARYNSLNYDDSTQIIDDVLSQILVEGDETLKPFIDKISAKLAARLEAAEEGVGMSDMSVTLPNHDCDVQLVFPNGDRVVIQVRPSNADVNYEGSLDFILPYDMPVTCWEGDDMKAAPALNGIEHTRVAKQLVAAIPAGAYETAEEE